MRYAAHLQSTSLPPLFLTLPERNNTYTYSPFRQVSTPVTSSAIKRPLSQSEPPPNPVARTSAQRLVLVVLSRVLRALCKLTGQSPADTTSPKYVSCLSIIMIGGMCTSYC